MTTHRSWTHRAYRAALLIFPRAFRERFGGEMVDYARERARLARAQGAFTALRFAISTCFDLARSAPAVWVVALRDEWTESGQPRDNMDILRQDLRFAVRA